MLGARDVVRVGAVQVAAGTLLRVQRDQDALVDGFLGEALLLFLRAVAPDDAVGLGELGHLVDPSEKLGIVGGGIAAVSWRRHDCRAWGRPFLEV